MPKIPKKLEKIPGQEIGGPTAFVIFGATGDLAKKRIFPSLYKLSKSKLLPKTFKIISAARTPHSTNQFRNLVKEIVQAQDDENWQDFAKQIEYISVDVQKDINLPEITKTIENFEKESKVCVKRIFYFAVLPTVQEKAVENLSKNKLHLGCQIHNNKPRIIIEKPFGYDLKSSQNLKNILQKYFQEDQIFRIDHYLGKETIQNIFAFRFANEIFEPIWNNKYVDHVQITVGEYIGVEKRGEFYDQTGALRDIVQNHMLQQMAIVTLEKPQEFEAASIQKQKLEILKSIKKLTPQEVTANTVRGQYEGYYDEEKIKPNSQTESYALVKLFIENPRWQGVPFYLRTGKKLPGKVTSIIFQFKEKGHELFKNFWEKPLPNHITIQVQPNEGIGIHLVAKKPGLATQLEPVNMEFCYRTSFDVPQPEAYDRLIMDVILGDQSLFTSQAEVEESWKITDPIREVWDTGKPKLETYKVGGWGPEAADKLIEKDGRHWLAPLLTICKI